MDENRVSSTHSTINYNCNGEGCRDENKVHSTHSTINYNCNGEGCSDEIKTHYSCIGNGCKDNIEVRHLTSGEAKDLSENVQNHVRGAMGAIDDALGGLLNPGFPFRPSNRRSKQEKEKEKEPEQAESQ